MSEPSRYSQTLKEKKGGWDVPIWFFPIYLRAFLNFKIFKKISFVVLRLSYFVKAVFLTLYFK